MPLKWVTKSMRWITGSSLTLRGAGGQSLHHYGRVQVGLKIRENYISLNFEVVDASRALLSVSAVADKGWRADFDPVQPMITKDAMTLYLKRRGGLYILEGEVQDSCGEQVADGEQYEVMPLESPDANEKNEHLSEDVKEQVTEAQPQELALPEKPDDATIRRHNLTHAEMASWCPVCVQARGRDNPHRASPLEERLTETVDEISLGQLDYT